MNIILNNTITTKNPNSIHTQAINNDIDCASYITTNNIQRIHKNAPAPSIMVYYSK